MTKEELVTECIEYVTQWMSYRDAMDLSYIFDKFFSQNVVIPKGENRHPYADVLHEWVEGAELELVDKNRWWKMDSSIAYLDRKKYRIKPSEPVYEWQWMYMQDDYTFKTENFYTDDEARKDFIKIEETKRERN